MNLVSLVIFLSLLLFAQIGCSVETTEQAPTSQPTVFFIAPSVPEDGYDTNAPIPVVMSTTHPTISPSGAQDGTGSTIDNELAEETRTAINTSSYIFYTFIGLIGCIGAAYLVKRYCANGAAQEATRYLQVDTRDPDEFFSRRNIEMTRGGLSNTRHF